MTEAKYDHKKQKLSSALGISDQRFVELRDKVGLVGFLSQVKSEALEIIMKDGSIVENEKPAACFLMGALLEQR